MKFLNFSSESPKFRMENGSMIWDVAPWNYGDKMEEIAITSCFIYFKKMTSYKPLVLYCSLIDADHANWNGIMATGVPRAKCFDYKPGILEFWKIDCSRPRTVVFALKDVDARDVDQINIVLALR